MEEQIEKKEIKKKKKNKSNYVLLKIIIVVCVFFTGACCMYMLIYNYPTKFTTMTTKIVKDVTVTDAGISAAVEKVYDAVVVVETYKDGKVHASGTGFVYKTKEGKAYILTNNHVIAGGDEIKVLFTNKKEIKAEVIGKDTYADIALLQIDSFSGIKVASIGKSDAVKVGDTVFAVGAPLDSAYSWTVTRGILSGKDRMVEVSSSSNSNSDWVMKVLQTDAAINSGNSGGPLANSNGEVIGITSLKLISSGVEGMGFAIPIETALEYADIFMNNEEITRPYLGISMYSLDEVKEAFYDSENISEGVYIADVEKGSPAYDAGLRKGDIVTKVNEDEIPNVAYFKYNLYKYKVGEKISITVYRGSNEKVIEVTLGENSN